jgi:predicted translin family RNA/ssDNA-binding protein
MENGETILSSQDDDITWLLEEVKRERRHALWVERRCWRTIPLYEAISHLQARIEAAEEERNVAEAEVERLNKILRGLEMLLRTRPLTEAEIRFGYEIAARLKEPV